MRKEKLIGTVIGVLAFIGVICGATYAWWTWNSSTNTDVNVSVEGLNITYVGGSDVTGSLTPTLTMASNNLSKTINIKSANVNVLANFYLEVITLPDELKHATFKWALYKETTIISSGDFSTAVVGTDILLTSNQAITTSNTADNWTLYLWIDGNYNNPSSMGKKNFSFNLKTTATNAPNV